MSTPSARFSWILGCSLALVLAACGDDGTSDEGGSGSSTGGSGSSGDPASTSGTPESTTGSSGDPGESTSTTDAVDSSGSSGEPGTTTGGVVADCDQPDEETCTMTEGCIWLGSPMNGACLPGDPSVCPMLEMQQCQQHPACDWDNGMMMCVEPG